MDMTSRLLNAWFVNEVLIHHAELRGFFSDRAPSVEVDDLCQETYLRILRSCARVQPDQRIADSQGSG